MRVLDEVFEGWSQGAFCRDFERGIVVRRYFNRDCPETGLSAMDRVKATLLWREAGSPDDFKCNLGAPWIRVTRVDQ